MWIIASLPFWFLGFIFLAGSLAAVSIKSPGETTKTQVSQMLSSILASGIFLLIAAKIAS